MTFIETLCYFVTMTDKNNIQQDEAGLVLRLVGACDASLKADVATLMVQKDRSESWIVRTAVRDYVDRHLGDSDQERAALTGA